MVPIHPSLSFPPRPSPQAQPHISEAAKTRTTRWQSHGFSLVTLFKIISYPEWCGDKPKTTRRGAEKGRGGSISYGNGGRGRNMGARANVAQVPHVGVTQETNVDKAKIEALRPHFEDGDWSGDVAFVENEFPFKSIDEKAHSSDVIISDSLYVDDEVHQMGVESHSPHSPSNDSEDVDGKSESNKHVNDTETITTESDPNTFLEAIKALENNGTWTITDLPLGKKVIGYKWVYKTKYNSDETIERHKARLVILGNKQVEGINYNETFAPIAKMVTVRVFFVVAAAKNWELHQMDVHNAFLHGDLHEEVYMKIPPGFSSQKSGKGDTHLNVLVYVDDLIISGNNSNEVTTFKAYLSRCFNMKDLGALKYFLGIKVAQNSEGIFLCQRKYALDIIFEAGLLGAKPANIPLEQHHRLALADGEEIRDPKRYRRFVGCLIYLTITRPELSYCVHVLSQFMQLPLEEHWQATVRVVRYIKDNPGQGIFLHVDNDLRLYGYCDSDWASCPMTRRSLTGYFVLFGNSPISWKTKKQHTVSRSSSEAEYRSMATTTCELKWLKGLLNSLGVAHPEPMRLFCDNQAALHIAANPVFHERTKHIEVDCHFVRDEILSGNLSPSYVHTSTQLADIFTKALGNQQFHDILSKESEGGESMDSDHCRESEGSRKGGSILMLMDELVKVGQTMGYNMDGCMKNIEEIIESQGVDGVFR
ncbi:retrovirus-related pol polyprotein from transposon TNT 1-94 [Tanacetum coccineum]